MPLIPHGRPCVTERWPGPPGWTSHCLTASRRPWAERGGSRPLACLGWVCISVKVEGRGDRAVLAGTSFPKPFLLLCVGQCFKTSASRATPLNSDTADGGMSAGVRCPTPLVTC